MRGRPVVRTTATAAVLFAGTALVPSAAHAASWLPHPTRRTTVAASTGAQGVAGHGLRFNNVRVKHPRLATSPSPTASPSPSPSPSPSATASASPTPSPTATATALPLAPVELNVTPALYDAAGLATVLDRAVGAGARSVYTVANWSALAPQAARQYDWSALDRLVSAAKGRGLGLRFQLTSTPDWVHPDLAAAGVPADQRRMTPPKGDAQLAQWKAFVGDLVGRYGTSVARYEIWNEPNIAQFFRPSPDPAAYVQVLKNGYEAVKAAAPTSQVLFGGLSRNDLGYLTAFYKAADAVPGVPANHWFDVLDVHPYSGDRSPAVDDPKYVWNADFGTMDENFLGFTRMRQLMADHGEGGKHVFLGEFGYSTQGDAYRAGVPDSTRATYLVTAYQLAGGYSWVDGMNWYSFMATPWDDPSWTLVAADGTPTATFDALVSLTH